MGLKIKNYYLLVIWRIILAYLIYMLCRLVFILFNYALLEPVSVSQFFRILGGGLMFDTSAIMYTNILYLFLSFLPLPAIKSDRVQKFLKGLYVTINFTAAAINLADTVYFRFTLRRTSTTFFTEFTGDVRFFRIFSESLLLYWYIFLIGIILLFVLFYLSGNTRNIDKNSFAARNFYVTQVLALLVTAPLFIIGVRGGTSGAMRPITIGNAGDYTDRAIHTAAVLNTPFSLIRTIGKAEYVYKDYYPSYADMEGVFTPIRNRGGEKPLNINNVIRYDSTAAGKNIVILMLESFGAENMSFMNENLDKCYTPFLDSLRKEGLFCTDAFANGRKSVDAIPSIYASIPSLISSYAVTPYSTDYTFGLPKILDSLGYYTAFFHGAPNTSMGIRAIARLCGIEHYYGKDEFNDNSKFDGSWGIWDEYFLPYVADMLDTLPQPFMAGIFTLSSHHPFKIPAEWEERLPESQVPLQKTIAYADAAVKAFFEKIRDTEWFGNTIFVITPDHSTLWGIYPEFTTTIGNTRIPIIYYAPGFIEPGEYNSVTQQLDIMPTLLGMIGYDKPYFAFGRDLNSDTLHKPFAVNYTQGQYQLVYNDTLLFRNDSDLTAVYDLQNDPLLKNNLLTGTAADSLRDGSSLKAQDEFFKAFIQQYINRLIDNKLSYEEF